MDSGDLEMPLPHDAVLLSKNGARRHDLPLRARFEALGYHSQSRQFHRMPATTTAVGFRACAINARSIRHLKH